MSLTAIYSPDLSRVRLSGSVAHLLTAGFDTSVSGWEAVGGTLTQSTLQAHTGAGSALLTPDGVSGVVRARTTLAASPTVTGDERHELTVWVYSPNGHEVDLSVNYLDGGGVSLDFTIWANVAVPAATWTFIAITPPAPAGAVTAQLNINQRNTPAATDTLHIDDVVFRTTTVDIERSTDQTRWQKVRGGDNYPLPSDGAVQLDDYEFTAGVINYYRMRGDLAQITPTLATVWLKNLARPFLNREITVTGFSPVERPARNGVFDIVGRSFPVAVTDVRSSRRYEVTVMTPTPVDADDLDLVLASGDPVFLHVPPGCLVPRSMYAVVGDITISKTAARGQRRYFALPLTEVAAPGPDIVGATITYQGISTAYPTYQALLLDNPTYADVVERIGDPIDVVVP